MISVRFRIAVRVREVVPGGFRVYQLRKPKNRHLVDVRQVPQLPPFREIGRVQVVEPAELAAMKAIAIAARKGQEKGLSDRLDLHRLLRAFPDLRAENGPVPARLMALGADVAALAAWREVVRYRGHGTGHDIGRGGLVEPRDFEDPAERVPFI